MTTSNHALVGSLIALSLKQPALVIPLAFVSHYILDVLPHFGNTNPSLDAHQKFRKHLFVEVLGLVGLILLIATGIYGWNLVTIAAIIATLPDIEWPLRYIFFTAKGEKPRDTLTSRLHKRIQWCEREWGLIVEIIFFAAGYALLISMT